MIRIRKRRTSVTVATSEVMHIRRGKAAAVEAYCEGCDTSVEWLDLDRARRRMDLPARILFRLVELDRIHFRETEGDSPLFCSASLAAASRLLLEGD